MKKTIFTFALIFITCSFSFAYPPEWGEVVEEVKSYQIVTQTFENGTKVITYSDGVVYIYHTTKEGFLGYPEIIYPEK